MKDYSRMEFMMEKVEFNLVKLFYFHFQGILYDLNGNIEY